MFPHDPTPADIPAVDAFMRGIGVDLTFAVKITENGHVADLQHYYLPHADPTLTHPEVRGKGIRFAAYWRPNAAMPNTAKQPKQAWVNNLTKFLYTHREITALPHDNHQYRLLDRLAGDVEDLGYPRSITATTAYLYATHAEVRRGWGRPVERDPDALAWYARLASDPRLTNMHRHDIAHRGLPLPELFTYLDADASYSLTRGLLGVADTEYLSAKS